MSTSAKWIIGLLDIPMVIATAFSRGWAIHTLWGWFLTPEWSIPAPSLVHAAGISVLVRLCVTSHMISPADRWAQEHLGELSVPQFLATWAAALLTPLFTVGIGWLIGRIGGGL